MTIDRIHQLVDAHRGDITGELVSVARIVDGLLDIRLEGAEFPGVVAIVDDALADIHGRTTAHNDWWREQLDRIDAAAAVSDALALATAPLV